MVITKEKEQNLFIQDQEQDNIEKLLERRTVDGFLVRNGDVGVKSGLTKKVIAIYEEITNSKVSQRWNNPPAKNPKTGINGSKAKRRMKMIAKNLTPNQMVLFENKLREVYGDTFVKVVNKKLYLQCGSQIHDAVFVFFTQ